MVDCTGKELKIGDKVVCSDMRYADLLIGEIIDFTPKKARVRYVRSDHQHLSQKEQLKESYQIFKYSDGDALHMIEDSPAADVAEVVRCKDCANLGFKDFDGICRGGPMCGILHPNDFCSRGVKKGGNYEK